MYGDDFIVFLDLLNAGGSRRRSQVRCQIAINKSTVFEHKALSFSITIFKQT